MTLVEELVTVFLPMIAAALKLIITNPAKFASLKGVLQTALNTAQTVVVDLQTILAGM